MTKSEVRKNRKRKEIVLAFIMILFTGIVLTASTYAWFTANRTVTVNSIDVNVSTSQGLQISVDAVNWKSVVTVDEITGANWFGVLNQVPTQASSVLSPVSTVGNVPDSGSGIGLMEMYKGTIENGSGNQNILVATQSVETNSNTTGDFVAFDLFIQSSQAQQIYLTSNSSVVATSGTTSTGIENAARVAFIKEGNVAYGATAASAQAIRGYVSKVIWEPNTDVHTAAAISNALNTYGTTTTATGGSKLAYNGVKAPIAASANIPLNSTNSSYFGSVTTVGSVAAGIPTNNYISLFEVAEGVTKVRIYMWIEGQDVDCEDRASGGSLSYSLQFSIDPNAG